MVFRTSWVLLFLFSLHIGGIYLFTRGFLLSRRCPLLLSHLVQTAHLHARYRRPTNAPSSSSSILSVSSFFQRIHHNLIHPTTTMSQHFHENSLPSSHAKHYFSTLTPILRQQHYSTSRLSSPALYQHSLISVITLGGHQLRRIPTYSNCIRPTNPCCRTLVADRFQGRPHLAYCLSDCFPPKNVARLRFFQRQGPTHGR